VFPNQEQGQRHDDTQVRRNYKEIPHDISMDQIRRAWKFALVIHQK
jgi:hypothetical protein